jgi:kinesin family protein 5
MEYSLKVSMCEIYNEKIKDLFDTKKNNLSIHQDRKGAIFIKNISE